MLIAAFLAAISCLYLWQVNDLSTLHDNTLELRAEARVLEQQNVILAQQLAQWNSPAYVDQRSTEQGYVVVSRRLIQPPAEGAVATAPVEPADTH